MGVEYPRGALFNIMAGYLKELIGTKVSIIANDGRHYIGTLHGLDLRTNLIVTDCVERIYSEDEGCEVAPYGLLVLRGDNVALIGELDEDVEARTDLETVRAAPLKPIVH
ncbi:U6 snRNA-associated Sm-like protein LSm8 [Hondaea fermentalgiana]|uniref:U6 snRNA-associated Sm-like protein LSm8 n=1 Tax=Hondaea fermentalgiana TaxID=2315210 RepID=A0A2R5G7U0_9STRA|nr:U6 snRNA-associated Sm-like protein LSm8 [Hondaea fermentalgiana]|eukprot:GBG24101.1 U6 snRNA-associated Sm-like protein LSm8 [Hondaea fermentalgiana]